MLKQIVTGATLAVVLLTAARVRAADDPLSTARDLYASAAYEDALKVLNGLAPVQRSRNDRDTIAMYRALCLVALGRSADAQQAMEALVNDDPSYRPPSDDLPPRVQEVLTATRKRLLPTIIQNTYNAAKTAFDHKDYTTAADGFQRVLDGLKDPDVAEAAGQPPLSDIRTLAVGFHDLSARAAAPPALVPTTPAPLPIVVAEPEPPPTRVFGAADRQVTPPAVVSQVIPPYAGRVVTMRKGVIEVIITESGTVEDATMPVPIDPSFDAHILSEARKWRYKPATLNGQPVKYRKLIQVALTPTP